MGRRNQPGAIIGLVPIVPEIVETIEAMKPVQMSDRWLGDAQERVVTFHQTVDVRKVLGYSGCVC